MSYSNDTICPACGSCYETIYYQRRAADEPPDKVVFCPICPLNTSKLSLDFTNNEQCSNINHETIVDRTKKFKHNKESQIQLIPKGHKILIRVEGAAASRCCKQIVGSGGVFRPFIQVSIPLDIGYSKHILNLYTTSHIGTEAHHVVKTQLIAPNVKLQTINVYAPQNINFNYTNQVVGGYEYILPNMEGSTYTIVRTMLEHKQPHIIIIVDDKFTSSTSRDKHILSVLHRILLEFGTENTVKSIISSSTISSLFTRSSKAYDWAFVPKEGYSYSWKPDGERYWFLKYGSIWLYSKRLLSGRISGWTMCDVLQYADKGGPILDIEVMIGHANILLDVLTLENGEPTKAIRSLDSILSEFENMNALDIPVVVKQYFRNIDDLLATKDSIDYPVDGVVGTQDGSTDIIKLKDTKAVELELDSNGNLLSADKNVVVTSTLHNKYKVGSILEVRFTRDTTTNDIKITDVILRTDKMKANLYDVCVSILNTISDMPENLARRKVLMWCNTIRHKLHQIASNAVGRGRVVLDIGSGDGQAISDYASNSEITYILLEPDKNKCLKLARRIGESSASKCRLYEKPYNIVSIISLVSKGSLKYAIICDTLDNLLRQDQAIRSLKGCIRYCVSSFSISYVPKQLSVLALNGIDVIGCGYMYDSINPLGVLVDDCGVKMAKVDANTAKVVWGSDKEYREPSITTADFSNVFYVRLASEIVSISADTDCSLLNNISSKVCIISTKKNI